MMIPTSGTTIFDADDRAPADPLAGVSDAGASG
jgi:hypothetical protein